MTNQIQNEIDMDFLAFINAYKADGDKKALEFKTALLRNGFGPKPSAPLLTNDLGDPEYKADDFLTGVLHRSEYRDSRDLEALTADQIHSIAFYVSDFFEVMGPDGCFTMVHAANASAYSAGIRFYDRHAKQIAEVLARDPETELAIPYAG